VVPEGFVRALDGFEAVLAGTPADRWLDPSPCEGWAAIDVAGHVTAGLIVVAARAAGRDLPEQDPDWREVAGEDPLASWRAVRARMTAALTPEALEREIVLGFGNTVTLRWWLEQQPLELLVHTWDLARATGQRAGFDADLVRRALETGRGFAEKGRAAGFLGPELAAGEDADDWTRLLLLFGRDPEWTPSASRRRAEPAG
jgi:uncharacterized protein (TIGR03086 family)